MKKGYSEEQIIKAIKEHEAGAKVDILRTADRFELLSRHQ